MCLVFWYFHYKLDISNQTTCFLQGSEEEKRVAHDIHRYSSIRNRNIYNLDLKYEVELSIATPDGTHVGTDVRIPITAANKTQQKQEIRVIAMLYSASYTGVTQNLVKKQKFEKEILDSEKGMSCLKLRKRTIKWIQFL